MVLIQSKTTYLHDEGCHGGRHAAADGRSAVGRDSRMPSSLSHGLAAVALDHGILAEIFAIWLPALGIIWYRRNRSSDSLSPAP